MKTKLLSLFIVFGFVLNFAGAAFADTKTTQNNELLALLPASDGVMAVDAKRFFASALPQILSGNKEMLDEIYAKMDEFKTNTGIDVRQFDQMAVGITVKKVSGKIDDHEIVALARGSFSADSLAKLANFASGGKHREEKIGDRTIYIFSPKEAIEKNKTTVKNGTIHKVLDNVLPGVSGEVAVTAYDSKTLAFGTPERVKMMFTESKSRVDDSLVALVNRKPNALISFAGNMPNGFADIIGLGDDDELGRNLNSIRQIYGMFDVAGENAMFSVSAKTLKPENAEGLKTSFVGLQSVFSGVLIGSKRESQKVLGRMLKNAKFTSGRSEVTIDLQVPQSDINILIGAR